MSFFTELKRRNVFRVGIAYIVGAWLLVQVADLALDIVGAEDWLLRGVAILLALGFIPAVIFAWAFELTPEGLKREKEVNRDSSITHVTAKKLDFVTIGLLVAVLAVVAVDRFLPDRGTGQGVTATGDRASILGRENGAGTAADGPSEPSIAVLPFVNMSSDPEQEYFSDGISEEILNALAGVKELKVAGRTSSFAFKGKDQDLRQIGETLGVDHILEGSVRKSGATVRITAQLIQADDGFHLWSDTYDRELTNVFEIQDEISNAILEQLKKHLVGVEIEDHVQVAQRTDPEVFDRYLLAKQRIYERKRLSIESAAELLDKAIAKDPNYAPAYAQRAIAALLLSEYNYGETKQAEAETTAKLYIDKALELDPELAEGWAALGLYHVNRPGESLDGIEALDKALSINPNLIDASNWLQIAYGNLGDSAKALAILEGMVERDPLYPPGFGNAVNLYNSFGRSDESFALIERIRPFLPGDPQVAQSEANTWMHLGKPSQAIPLLETALGTQPNDAVMRQFYGWGLLATGQYDKVATDGHPWHRAIALTVLGRQEEARIIGEQQAATGEVSTLINLLYRTGQFEQLVEFVETRWADLAIFQREYPDGGSGADDLIAIAWAYSQLGNQAKFDEALALIKASHDTSINQGIEANYFWISHARYLALLQDSEAMVEAFAKAVESGWMVALRPEQVFQEMQFLAGEPGYEAVVTRLINNVNTERTALGLEPVNV